MHYFPRVHKKNFTCKLRQSASDHLRGKCVLGRVSEDPPDANEERGTTVPVPAARRGGHVRAGRTTPPAPLFFVLYETLRQIQKEKRYKTEAARKH